MKLRSPRTGPWADINTIQIIRRVALFILAAILGIVLLRVGAAWGRERLERAGLTACATVLVCLAVIYRAWASLYISDRKTGELVTLGPYSVTRNPLYLSSVIGAFGALLQFGSIVVAAFATVIAYVIFMIVIMQEERLLSSLHERDYQKYREEVPRFWPRWSRMRSLPTLPVTLAPVIRTIVDSSFFFVTVPLSAFTEALQYRFPDLLLFRLP